MKTKVQGSRKKLFFFFSLLLCIEGFSRQARVDTMKKWCRILLWKLKKKTSKSKIIRKIPNKICELHVLFLLDFKRYNAFYEPKVCFWMHINYEKNCNIINLNSKMFEKSVTRASSDVRLLTYDYWQNCSNYAWCWVTDRIS